jgi:hypothetical protein
MTERAGRQAGAETPPARSADVAPSAAKRDGAGEDAERALGRAVAIGLPVLSVVCAIVVGFVASVGSGLLVLASGALIGTIALLWASVRTLSGDAPLPADLEALSAQNRDIDALAEDKRRVLRALKDIESEHALGKIDDADYETIATQYRQEAKALMREMDQNAAPGLAEAERIAREYLAKQGLGPSPAPVAGPASRPIIGDTRPSRIAVSEVLATSGKSEKGEGASERGRVACPECATSNEPDAAFCKKCGAAVKPAGAAAVKESDATS